MTKEQEEAIDYVQKQIDYFKEQIKFIEAVDSDYYEEEYELYKNRTKQFSTVLNLIQEQQEENKKKDKIIDLMSEKLAKAYHYKPYKCTLKEKNNIDCDKYKDCVSCVKQYWERKAEDVKN